MYLSLGDYLLYCSVELKPLSHKTKRYIETQDHYENLPMQHTEIRKVVKNENFAVFSTAMEMSR